jgi:hypothetical protein
MGRYVNAWSTDVGEELDQQRVVLGGVVTGLRKVITRAKQTMAVATIEDLQGSTEVIVFPKTYEETASTWVDDAVLLIAGRIDHKGEETVLLADSVWTWEQVQAMGAEAFGASVAAGDRGRRGRQGGWNGNGNGGGNGSWARGERQAAQPVQQRAAVPVRAEPVAVPVEPLVRTVPLVSPLRGGGVRGTIDVLVRDAPSPSATRMPVRVAPGATPTTGAMPVAGVEPPDEGSDDEPPWPEEAQRREAAAAAQPTAPLEATTGRTLHVRFGSAPMDRVIDAFGALRELFAGRPGETPVVLHVPAGSGREQPMQLRAGVAYDAELLGAIERRVGGLVRLQLA